MASSTRRSWRDRRHRALASPERRRLLDLLAEPDEGRVTARDAHDLADELGRHVNTVRAHLAVLEDAGLVRSRTEQRRSRGRPRRLYRATVSARSAASEGHAALVDVLAHHLSDTSDDPAHDAEQAGMTWGERLADDAPGAETSDGLADVVNLLDTLGFDPEVEAGRDDEPRVALHHCPFADVARAHEEVVCSIHLGMLRGFSQRRGTGLEVTALDPFVRPDLCVTHLRQTPSEAPA